VPLGRYFLWVGGVLLAMIFVVGWVWPSAAPAPVQEASTGASTSAQMPTDPTNSMILRIQSARKLPDKIVFDTSAPAVVPLPAPPMIAAAEAPPAPVAAAPLEARAEMKPSAAAPPAPPKRVAKVHHRNVRPAASSSNWAYANPGAQQQWSGWSNSPRWSWNW